MARPPDGGWLRCALPLAAASAVLLGSVVTAQALNSTYLPAVLTGADTPTPSPAPTSALPVTSGRLAFESSRDGNWEIYVMDADGSNQTRLTDDPATDYHAAWSPDGTRIAFASDRDGDFDIYTMNADGSGVTRLTDNSDYYDDAPSWSPDGSRIAYESGCT